MNIIEELDKEQLAALTKKRRVPEFGPGDTVRVNVKVIEGERSRVQAYEGVCIGRAGGGINENFAVRKISYGEGVERVFPIHSPLIDSIEVVLRGRRGKAARIPERQDARGKKKATLKRFTKPKGPADDLKLIEGLTPELEKKLNKVGLIQFAQIANLTDEEITQIDDALSMGGQIEHDDWSGKAVALMAETTAEEVPAEEEPKAEAAEGKAEAEADKSDEAEKPKE